MSRAVVIGAGMGGLAAALRLRVAGHDVVVLERNDTVGGKLATLSDGGYTFDLGPSLLTLPHVFDDLLSCAGTTLAREVDLVRLDPQFAYHWSDGSTLVVPDDASDTAAAFDEFSPGSGAAWRRFDERGRRIWDVSERTFFTGPMDHPWSLVRRMRSPMDLFAIDPLRTLHRAGAASFGDTRLQQWADRYATYSGSSPYRAPATLACIPHIESRFGCWYTMGGLGAVRDAVERAAVRTGVVVRTGVDVTRIVVEGADGRVAGVESAEGERHPADVVIADVDSRQVYGELLDDPTSLRRVERADPSTSGFVVCAGVRGQTPGIGHHNVWFSTDYRAEFADLDAGRLPSDPTVYGCVSVVTDPSQAPEGCENWFLLVNTPADVDVDPQQYLTTVWQRLRAHGIDLEPRVEVVHTLTPRDIARRDRSPDGAIYGTSSNGRRAAFVRPSNRGRRPGLYLVGGSSHPGGGLPLVTLSARIVADLVGPA